MAKKTKRKSSPARAALKVLCSVLGVVLIVLIGATGYAQHLLGKINYVKDEERLTLEEIKNFLASEQTDPDATGETLRDEDIDWGTSSGSIGKSENIVNILLIGQDARPDWGRSRSDAMILCTINKEQKTITMTSFLRDLYVQIPGYGNSKLNHTYAWGGMELLNETLEQNFGLHVDGNIEVNFERFSSLIDLLGGVDIELRADEARTINADAGGNLTEGMQHLNGAQTLSYSRIRKLDADSDFSRTNRQRKVLTSLMNSFKSANLSTMLSLLNEALPMLTTDMTQTEIIGYATELFPILADATIVSQRIPADNTYSFANASGMSVIKADMDAARQLLKDTLGED